MKFETKINENSKKYARTRSEDFTDFQFIRKSNYLREVAQGKQLIKHFGKCTRRGIVYAHNNKSWVKNVNQLPSYTRPNESR